MLKDKIIALDVDGTIAEDCTLPSLNTCNQINELINQGYNIVLITGRGFATIKYIYNTCKMNTFCVVFNGGYVFNPISKEEIRNVKLKPNYLFELLENETFKNAIDDIMVEQGENIYSLNGLNCYNDEETLPLNECLKDDIYCINTKVKDPAMHKIIEEIVNKSESYRYRYWHYLGEIYNINYTKKDGAEALLKHYNKTFDDLVFIGDSDNDLEILKAAGIGVAMKNATKQAKSCADEITEFDVLENGAIKHLLKMINGK